MERKLATKPSYLKEGKPRQMAGGSDEMLDSFSKNKQVTLQLDFIVNNVNRVKKLLKSKSDFNKIKAELGALETSFKKIWSEMQKTRRAHGG